MSTSARIVKLCKELGIDLPGEPEEYRVKRVRSSRGKYSGAFAWALQPQDLNRWSELLPVEVASYFPATELLKNRERVTAHRSRSGLNDFGWILIYTDDPS